MRIHTLSFPVMVLVCLGLLVATGYGEEKTRKETVFKAQVGADGLQRVEMLGDSYSYTPNHIIVKVNTPVELSIKKTSRMVPHNIVIKAPQAGIDFDEAMGNEPRTIKFTPTKTGKYPFYCSKKLLFFESHRDKGMEGTLEVVE